MSKAITTEERKMIGRPYQPAGNQINAAQRATIKQIKGRGWVETRPLASGEIEVAFLNYSGIIERIVTVFEDGSHTVGPNE